MGLNNSLTIFRINCATGGITHGSAFLEELQTNGVVERFFRALKEQVIYGDGFRNITELRQAIAGFIPCCSHRWRPEKNGLLSLHQAREAWVTYAAA